jgi:hypothetical protein
VHIRRLGLSISSALLVAIVAAAPAHAAESVEAGWWTSTPVPVAPDAPDGGLVVQAAADPNQPFSYAAVAYDLAGGELPTSLTLTVADGSVSTTGATLALCPLTTGFAPSQGAPISEAPSFDCTMSATAAPDGATYQFDVTQVYDGQSLALAVLATAPADRVVLAPPSADGLQTVPTNRGASTPDSSESALLDEPAAAPFDSGTSFEPSTGLTSDIADVATPAPDPVSPSVTAGTGSTAFSPTRSLSGGDDESLLAAALLGALLVIAAALWSYAGAPRDVDPAATT